MKFLLFILPVFLLSCVPQTGGEGRQAFGVSTLTVDDNLPQFDADPIRPNNAVFIEPDYCVCQKGRPFIIGSACAAVCETNQNIVDTRFMLYGNIRLSEELKLDSFFQNGLIDWCKKPMPNIDSNEDGIIETFDDDADCEMQVSEKFENFPRQGSLPMLIGTTNNFQVDLTSFGIEEGKTYRLRIKAESSLTQAFSDYIEFQVSDSNGPFDYGGLLSINQVKRYQCLFKTGPNPQSLENVFNRYLFFDSAYAPPPLPTGVRNVVCHNDGLGADDQVNFPRLDESNAFRLWDRADRRFSFNFPNGIDDEGDNNANQNDINYFVTKLMREQHNRILNGDIFLPLTLTVFPGTESINSIQRNIGYILLPYSDPLNMQNVICPTAANLAIARQNPSTYPLFDVLDEFIDDSESLFIALRTPREIDPISNNFVDDVIHIPESQLQDIWFYYQNSSPVAGPKTNDSDYLAKVGAHTMYFYWPVNGSDPLIQSSGQKIYKVVSASELEAELNGLPPSFNTSAPAPDKKIACIPRAN